MENIDQRILLGIDIGTTGAKCTFYNLNGFPVASEYQEYAMIHPQPGWAEESPNEWWEVVVQNIKQCITENKIDSSKVAGIGVSCTNSIIPLGKNGEVLYNAILQLDQRAEEEVGWVEENIGAERIFQVTGNRIARGTFSLPTLRWFLNHRPDIMERTYKFVVPSGFIIHRLTGEFTINSSRMGFTLLSNIRTGAWDEDLIRDAGLSIDKFPRPANAYEIVGKITREVAVLTGLTEGTPVVAGAMDTVAAAVGAGAVHDGDAFLAIGTCGRLCFSTKYPVFDNRLMNCRSAYDKMWLNVEATNGAGISLRWFRDVFGDVVIERAKNEDKSVYAVIDELAETSVPGANGVIYLPYLSGERCPVWDPNARGVFFGIHLGTTYGDIARAIMEGVAFSIKQGMEIVLESGKQRPKTLSLGGGIAKSRIWSRIFTDVLGFTIVKLEVNETETLGDAILAAYGVGLIDNMAVMAKSAAESGVIMKPDKRIGLIYNDYFEVYKNLYLHLKGDFAALDAIRKKYTVLEE